MFRATRGKVLVFFSDQPFMPLNSETPKVVYLLVYDRSGGYLRDTVSKICNSFSQKVYNLPEELQGIQTYSNLI